MTPQEINERLRGLLVAVLAIPGAVVADFKPATGLFGHRPEVDSMALAQLLGALEESFAITINDDEIDADIFASYGALLSFVRGKMAS